MKIFIDSADLTELKSSLETGLIDGVTTNPSLVMSAGGDFIKTIEAICALTDGPVSAEVAATDYQTMIKEGEKLSKIAKNVAIKVPLTVDGLKACQHFRNKDIMVNVTLCFSANQALLAAKAGATFISPFIGRLDDIGHDGMELIAEIRNVYDNYPEFDTMILAASIRHPQHVTQSALVGADVATIPPKIFKQMFSHTLTDLGVEKFVSDWKKTGQSIL